MKKVHAKVMLRQVENDGYAVQENVLSEAEINELIESIERRQDGEGLLRQGRIFAVRNLLDLPEIRTLAESTRVQWARSLIADCYFRIAQILESTGQRKRALAAYEEYLSRRQRGHRSIYSLRDVKARYEKLLLNQPDADP